MRQNSGVPSAEVHVTHSRPPARVRIENLHALAHERPVVASDGIEQTSEDAYACERIFLLAMTRGLFYGKPGTLWYKYWHNKNLVNFKF